MPADPQQILADPNFHALPLGERLKVMRTVDPNFAALPAKDQGTVLYQAAVKANPRLQATGASEEDRPVMQRALENLPGSLANFVRNAPLAPSSGPAPIQDEHGNWVLPPISLSGELGGLASRIGNMVFHPVESFAQDPVGEVAFPAMAAKGALGETGRGMMKGAAKGAWQEATAPTSLNIKGLPISIPMVPKSITSGALGYEVGSHFPGVGSEFGGPAGAVIGATIPPIRGAVRGAKEAYKASKVQPIQPMPLGLPAATHNMPGAADTSGPIPFTPPEYWNNPPAGAPPDIQTPKPAAQPSSGPVTGLHLPEVPPHYAGEPNPVAAFKNDQAVAAELRKVPGITKGTLTPEMVHEVRKAIGQRRLKDADVARRVEHIRFMLPD